MLRDNAAVARGLRGGWLCAFGTAVAGALLPGGAAIAAENNQVVEEIIVTGSYIRRGDSFDTATPISVMNADSIAEQGVTHLGEAVRNQTFQYGVDTVSNVLGQVLGGTDFQTGTNSQGNLYGLGENSTLTLMNGRRTEVENLQTMYPKIMVDRLETLTDGAATAYGTDAVAGVINVIPKTDFEGMEFEYSYNNDGTSNDWDEQVWSMMLGTGNDRTRIVAAVEYRDRSRLSYRDRPDLLNAQLSTSSTGNPGVWLVPTRNPDGSLTGSSQQLLDPGCGLNREPGSPQDPAAREPKTKPINNPTGIVGLFGTRCLFEFAETINYADPQEVLTGVMVFEHEFTDNLRFSGEMMFNFSDQAGGGGDSPTDPGGRLAVLPTVPAHHPGNPYRAMVDTNGDGTLDTPIFAQDANGDGIPDLDGSGQVVLAADPFDPTGGVAFAEQVTPISWRQTAKLQCLEHTPNDPRTRGDCNGELAFFSSDQFRVAGRIELDIPDTTWYVYLDALWHSVKSTTFEHQATSVSALQRGFVGELNIPQSDARWFNPFSTQAYACTNRDCTGRNFQTDFDQLNQTEVWQQIQQDSAIQFESELAVQELVASGELFDLPAGAVGMAVGVQHRFRRVESDAAPLLNARDEFVNLSAGDYAQDRETLDIFVELQIPLFDNDSFGNAELNLAGRYTDSWDASQADLKDEIFKVSARWEPRPWIAIRASAGQAFIAPTIESLFTPPTFQVGNVTDTLTGGATAFIAQGAGGTANLKPETSDQFNIGFTARFLDDDLNIHADWKRFEFKDRIARSAVQDVIQDNVELFDSICQPVAGVCTAGGPAYQGLVVEDGLSPAEPGIDAREVFLRNNPNQPGANPGVVGESNLIRRNPNTLALEAVVTPLLNLAEMEWEGMDIGASYTFEGSELPFINRDIGLFTVGIEGTWVQTFEVTEPGGVAVDGVGKRNQPTGFLPAIPEFRTVSRVNWTTGRHSATLLARHNSKMEEDDAICALPGAVLVELGAQPGCPDEVPAKVLFDFNYRMDLDGLLGSRSASLEFGAINIFDTYPPTTAALGSIETFIYDPRGRQFYARVRAEL